MTSPTWAGLSNLMSDSVLDSGLSDPDSAENGQTAVRWIGWRLRLLVVCALLGCLGIFALIRTVMVAPQIEASWRVDAQDRIVLATTRDPALAPHIGQTLVSVQAGGAAVALSEAFVLNHSPRWVIDDTQRARLLDLQDQLGSAFARDRVTLSFAQGGSVELRPAARGLGGLGIVFWLLSLFSFALYLVAMVLLLAQPSARNLVYAVMALCQSGNLMFIALESIFDFGLPPPFARLDLPVRIGFDLITAAAMVNAACLHPRRLPGSGWIALLGWGVALALTLGLAAAG